jgi:ATP-dependent Zn protease
MSKINKKSINYGLKILTIFAFILVFIPFNKVSAYVTGCGEGGCNTVSGSSYNVPLYQLPTPVAPQDVTQTVYTNNTNKTKNNSTQTNTNTTQTTNTSNTVAPTTQDNTNSTSDLVSNAIFGSGGFLPSGLIQWILFAIIILVIVILARKIFGGKEAYEEAPMKYE